MPKLLPNNIYSIQARIKRGTKVKVHDTKNDLTFEAEFDGFTGVECPYRFCELNPRNPKAMKEGKSCNGFMIWNMLNVDDEHIFENCPLLGGLDFTIGDSMVVTHILVRKQKPNGQITEEWVEPTKY